MEYLVVGVACICLGFFVGYSTNEIKWSKRRLTHEELIAEIVDVEVRAITNGSDSRPSEFYKSKSGSMVVDDVEGE
jgi:hypothetical protein